MEEIIRNFAKLSLLLFSYIFLSFFYQGVTTIPTEGDSLAYHIPIAVSVLDGSVFTPSREGYALGYYPGSAEVLLSVLMLLKIPLNVYNLIAWVLLAYLCVRVGDVYRLSGALPILFAVSTTTVLAMIRLLNNQTIDIWLAVFFTWGLLLLKSWKKTPPHFFFLGIALGLLVGSKFSGPLYAAVLFICFAKTILSSLSLTRFIAFSVPFFLLGLSWYIRNIALTGNPFYPQAIAGLPGNDMFQLMQWVGWTTIFYYPNGVVLMLFAIFQEYMVWTLMLFIGAYVLVKISRSKKSTTQSRDTVLLLGLGLTNFLIFFFLPSTGNNISTYLRYLFPAFIPLILAGYLLAERYKKVQPMLLFALMNIILVIPLTPHRPKLILVYLPVSIGILYLYPHIERILLKR